MSVSRTVSEIFSVIECRDFETGGRGRSRSLKMEQFDRPYTTFYWSTIVNIALSCTLNNTVTLQSELEITHGHLSWYHSKARVQFPICLP